MPYTHPQQLFTQLLNSILEDVDTYIEQKEDPGKLYTDKDVLDCINKTVKSTVSNTPIGELFNLYEEYWKSIEQYEGRNVIFKVNNWLVDQVELIYSKRYAWPPYYQAHYPKSALYYRGNLDVFHYKNSLTTLLYPKSLFSKPPNPLLLYWLFLLFIL